MEKIAGHEGSKSLRVIIIFNPQKDSGHFRLWSFPVIIIFKPVYRWLNP